MVARIPKSLDSLMSLGAVRMRALCRVLGEQDMWIVSCAVLEMRFGG